MSARENIRLIARAPFCFLILTAKFRNRAMLFDMTLIELFYIDIGFKTNFYLIDLNGL